MTMASNEEVPDFLKSTWPVFFPTHPAFFYPPAEFTAFCQKDLKSYRRPQLSGNTSTLPLRTAQSADAANDDDKETLLAAPWNGVIDPQQEGNVEPMNEDIYATPKHPFVEGLLGSVPRTHLSDNQTLTENADVTYRSTKDPLVDLFYELEDHVSEQTLNELLTAAWEKDASIALKIIFNARSIHLGKSSRNVFYRCIDWLALQHPTTCISSLQWLPRPVILKKAEKEGDEEAVVFVEPEKDQDDPSRFDVRNGVAHGYYKDLLNILALVVNRKLDKPKEVLNVERLTKSDKNLIWDTEKAAKHRHDTRDVRHATVLEAFAEDAFYRCLHLMVARIFAEQLRADLRLLRNGDKEARRQISLCAKWAPSSKGFHDKHTFVVSSIAELLHPQDEFVDVTDREQYLRHAREQYRKGVAALRKELAVVERDISANTLQNIKYERVPSQAMSNYRKLFAQKDYARFSEYMVDVAAGKKQISGATLLPSTMIHEVRNNNRKHPRGRPKSGPRYDPTADVIEQVADAQWQTMVKRIKESGSLESSIAVCDVSGSMQGPRMSDGTTPMDSAIGLSLLLAEVVQPPFGGVFITFSEHPQVVKVDLSKDLHTKVSEMEDSGWGTNTDFVAVFEDLILPMALEHNLKQEDMVKRIFVFSDMHFDGASAKKDGLSSSYERIQAKYRKHGYEMPELIYWNLAGGRAGQGAPKPVTAGETGTALVSGYSQGMLKVFLDKGGFDDDDDDAEESAEVEEQTEINSDGEEVTVVHKAKRRKMDPLAIVKKAISHKAYDMFEVLD